MGKLKRVKEMVFIGYYTDPSKKANKKGSGWLLPIIIGLAMGVLLMLVFYPHFLEKRNIINDSENNEENNNMEMNNENPPNVEQLTVEVSTQITDIVEKVSPAVVGITNIQRQTDFWNFQGEENEAGTGSGVIYKISNQYAYIVTNHHVVDQADMLEVVLNDETTVEAELLGSDLFTDLAVLRVKNEGIKIKIEMGSSESLRVGEPVIAIGNPLGHMFAGSVTQGIISGKQRTIPQDFNQDGQPDWQTEVIQTDAAINPGNSGGALINMNGQLIGINSMKIRQNIAQGIGFAIPIATASPLIDELEQSGVVTRPFLGVEIYSLEEVPKVEWKNTLKLPDEVEGGIYIWHIEPLSPADQAGLQRLDVITEFAGKKVNDILDLRKELYQNLKVGDEVKVTYYRDGEKGQTSVKLGEQR